MAQTELFAAADVSVVHPGKVDVKAALHMASLEDAYEVHRGCSLPQNPPLCPQAPRNSIVQDMHQHIFDRCGSQDTYTLPTLPTVGITVGQNSLRVP
jgi:hypothetical protein